MSLALNISKWLVFHRCFYLNNNEISCLQVHSQDPHRLECMDIYSTALWHLQKEVALSALAHDLINTNKTHPITWCVSGNCFSLHKEHDTAIKFFQRAVQVISLSSNKSKLFANSGASTPQVDPKFHYAYTLLGHEYITTEELDKAMSCFWNAIRINPRHYNAWFGVGTIYSKQERYSLAEWNYSRALSINPKSSVILCHIGIVQHALKQVSFHTVLVILFFYRTTRVYGVFYFKLIKMLCTPGRTLIFFYKL